MQCYNSENDQAWSIPSLNWNPKMLSSDLVNIPNVTQKSHILLGWAILPVNTGVLQQTNGCIPPCNALTLKA